MTHFFWRQTTASIESAKACVGEDISRRRRLAKRSSSPVPVDSTDIDDLIPLKTSIPLQVNLEPMSQNLAPARLLIASLGNPAPYLETRHSAGHILIKSLAQVLSCQPFTKSRAHGNGLTTTSFQRPEWLLWQSPSLMNISGPSLRDALQSFIRSSPATAGPVGIVILHDELESPLGQIKERNKNSSHKGHNGLKSVGQTLKSSQVLDQVAMIKIGVGIGRPDTRDRGDVSNYVLKKMTREEKQHVEDGAVRTLELIEAFAQKLGQTKQPPRV